MPFVRCIQDCARLLLEHGSVFVSTRVPLPIKVVRWVAPALPSLVRFTLWAVLEGFVSISDIVEEVDLILASEQCRADGVHGRIAPSLVVKSSCLVQVIEEIHVRLRPPEVEVTEFKVGPDWSSAGATFSVSAPLTVTLVVRLTAVVRKEGHCVVLGDVLRIVLDEAFR